MDETDELFSAELDAHGDAAETALVLALAALYAANNRPSEEQINQAISGVLVPYLLAVLVLLSTGSEQEPVDLYQVAEDMSREASDMLKDELANLTAEANRNPNLRGFEGDEFRARLRALLAATITSVTNRALVQLAEQLGYEYKSWRTRLDVRVRLSHQSLEGQTVPLDAMFVDFQGVRLEYPGDRRAPIAAWINCRCRLSFSRERAA